MAPRYGSPQPEGPGGRPEGDATPFRRSLTLPPDKVDTIGSLERGVPFRLPPRSLAPTAIPVSEDQSKRRCAISRTNRRIVIEQSPIIRLTLTCRCVPAHALIRGFRARERR